uniref:Uncharacterized protein n=1 Tax=Plectus sambesii TaxID=2011161 RepID=A0A914UKQ5_9BILA
MAGLTVYQIYERSAYYCMQPITVVVTESNEDGGVMPAMVICPPGQFRASLAINRDYNPAVLDWGALGIPDLFNFEQHRDTFISYFRRTNISFTNADVDTLFQELKSIYADLKSAYDEEKLSNVLNRLDNISASLKDRFPVLASKLSIKEPIFNGMISLKAANFTNLTNSDEYAKYRALNGLYDGCAKRWLLASIDASSSSNWNRALRNIMKCRLGGDNDEPDKTIRDLIRFTTYSRLINLVRPKLTDVIL